MSYILMAFSIYQPYFYHYKEIVQVTDRRGRVYFKMLSHPNKEDSDLDGSLDAVDSEPLKYNRSELYLDQIRTIISTEVSAEMYFIPSLYTGGYRLHISGGSSAVVELFEKNLFGKEKILLRKEYNGDDDDLKFRMQLSKDKKYYIRVIGMVPGQTYRISVVENVDQAPKFEDIGGGTWVPIYHEGSQSGPLSGYSINEIIFFDKSITEDLWDKLLNLKPSDTELIGEAISINAVVSILTSRLKMTGPEGFLLATAVSLMNGFLPNARLQMLSDNVVVTSAHFKKGVILYAITMQTNGMPVTQIIVKDSWNGEIMRGEVGYIGEFSADVNSVWNY